MKITKNQLRQMVLNEMKNVKTKRKLNEIDENDIKSIITKKLKEFGLKIQLPEIEQGKWNAGNLINIKDFGDLKPVIETATLLPAFGYSDSGVFIRLDYKWEHPRGHNGYEIQYTYDIEKGTWDK